MQQVHNTPWRYCTVTDRSNQLSTRAWHTTCTIHSTVDIIDIFFTCEYIDDSSRNCTKHTTPRLYLPLYPASSSELHYVRRKLTVLQKPTTNCAEMPSMYIVAMLSYLRGVWEVSPGLYVKLGRTTSPRPSAAANPSCKPFNNSGTSAPPSFWASACARRAVCSYSKGDRKKKKSTLIEDTWSTFPHISWRLRGIGRLRGTTCKKAKCSEALSWTNTKVWTRERRPAPHCWLG